MGKTLTRIVISILMGVLFFSSTIVHAKVINAQSLYTSGISHKTNFALEKLHNTYPESTELKTIGVSQVGGKPIQAIKVGKGEKSILINGAHHARETMTTILILDQIEYLAKAYEENMIMNGQNVREILNTVAIWFVPLVNPDGADKAMSSNPSWKANGRGVDLNRNYPTPLGRTKPTRTPGSQGYAGTAPFSESETKALRDLCYEEQFETNIAYHSAGQIIYWWFYQKGEVYNQSVHLARILANITGYALVPSNQSMGGLGFTDWFIQEFNKPGFTPEIGKVANGRPLGWWEYAKIWKDNKDVPLKMCQEIIKINTGKWQGEVKGGAVQAPTVFGRTILPIKEISNIMDVKVTYLSESQQLHLSKGNVVLKVKVGDLTGTLNEEQIMLPIPIYQKNGTTYIPVRTMLDLFDFTVQNNDVEEENTGTEEENTDVEENIGTEENTNIENEENLDVDADADGGTQGDSEM
ncbi:MAG: M14 family zinc carboxypeptidase [Cellulosilyticaceae bacterium]